LMRMVDMTKSALPKISVQIVGTHNHVD
jgi:hypothetical protein